MIIDCKSIAQKVKDEVKEEVSKLQSRPKLAVIQVGDNEASDIYLRSKRRACEEVGIEFHLYKNPADHDTDSLCQWIRSLCSQNIYDGVMVQLPLPEGYDEYKVINSIDPDVDVDGLTDVNVGRLWNGTDGLFPCTALGIITIIKSVYKYPPSADILIAGRSRLVGKPLIALALRNNMTPTIMHSYSRNVIVKTAECDVFVTSIGKPKHWPADLFSEKTLLIDVGINKDEDGKLCGDFDPRHAYVNEIDYTPVPGGVGLITVAMLTNNVLKAYKMRRRLG